MAKYILKRILWLIPVIIGVISIIFFIMQLMPGDVISAILGNQSTEAAREALRVELGLDQPVMVRWFNYVVGVFTRFDFGTSYISGQPIGREIAAHLPVTIIMAVSASLFGAIVGMPLGVLSALKQYTWVDSLILVLTVFVVSMPSFWLALMLIKVFAVNLQWLPAFGLKSLSGWVLPMFVNCLAPMGLITRITRSSLLEVMREDYVRTARAKGQVEKIIIVRHMLRNALIPVVTSIGAGLAGALGGNMAIEIIFALPGLGNYVMTSISNRNYTAMLGGILVTSIMFTVVNLIVDLIYVAIDPRLKTQMTGKKIGRRKSKQMMKELEEESCQRI